MENTIKQSEAERERGFDVLASNVKRRRSADARTGPFDRRFDGVRATLAVNAERRWSADSLFFGTRLGMWLETWLGTRLGTRLEKRLEWRPVVIRRKERTSRDARQSWIERKRNRLCGERRQ